MKKSAELFCKNLQPEKKVLEVIEPRKADGRKIRVGYFSADFSEHATMILMARFFEIHDKSRFELFGFSFGPERMDHMRIRAEMAFDHFMDVRPLTDRAVALLARYFEIDIAIDLKGYTTHSRPGIFAHRAAPVQINYLGFPGTMGTPYMDYIIADDVIIPTGYEQYYSEKVLRLPRCYQVNDNTRRNKGQTFTRAMLGLPEDAFVFCSFNNNYKISAELFDIWCRLLKRIENSVLWIMVDNEFAKDNLIHEAEARGIAEERLIFTPRCNQNDHISRQVHGDLLLDTFPCNAHTTASDALFAGLPVLTIRGETFASRVAASILTSAGLEELVTDSYQAYEDKAFELATNTVKMNVIKERLRSGIATSELYDTEGFARDFEALLLEVAEKHDMI
jgi:predicted O-linked N-acetylglucosamine transferase (SPINDLY family)